MYNYRIQLLIAFLTATLYYGLQPTPVKAQFQPPSNVTLTMYRLNRGGDISTDPKTNKPFPCQKKDTFYGCTADEGNLNLTYPFNTSTITIGIDGTGGADNAQYAYPYLWDVVPQELDINGSQGNKPLSAVKAQAIAARTYIYQRILYADQYGTPNNSTQFHVFLPHRYATLTSGQQVRVQEATNPRLYMAEADGTNPIEALYGADNPADTVAGNRPYLKSVADPISTAYGGIDGTGNGGMSSKGASRWSFGHTSSRGPVAENDPYYPHDDGGYGDFWSTQWNHTEQILTHYYTGIHLRDANNNNAILTPRWRWVPLQIDAPKEIRGCVGAEIPIRLWLQNTGTTTWPANAVTASIVEAGTLAAAVDTTTGSTITTTVAMGSAVVVNRTFTVERAGAVLYNLSPQTTVDDIGFFSNQGWPAYKIFTVQGFECGPPIPRAYLPFVQSNSVAGQ